MKSRSGNVELLRFLFIWAIILCHFNMKEIFLPGGWLGVEFFFIVTGYYLGKKVANKKFTDDWKTIVCEVYKDLWKRIKKIYPYLIISSIIGIIFLAFSNDWTTEYLLSYLKYAFGDFIFTQQLGGPAASVCGINWYLSAMLFSVLIIYPFLRRNYDLFSLYIAPIVFLLVLCFLEKTNGTLNAVSFYYAGFINSGVLRGIGMMSLGVFLNAINDIKIKISTWIATIIEVVCYTVVFVYMRIWKGDNALFEFDIILFLAIGCFISLGGYSVFSNLLNGKFFSWLGKMSMVLFMSHFNYSQIYMHNFCYKVGLTYSEFEIKICGLVLCVVSAIFIELIVGLINKIYRVYRKK